MIYSIRKHIPVAVIVAFFVFCGLALCASQTGCAKSGPLEIDDLRAVMPGDNTNEYDVYRVVAVKEDVTKQELIGLMEFFTKEYLDTNRVMIYVFNKPAAAHLGQSKYIVATYFQDKSQKKYEREILLDRPI